MIENGLALKWVDKVMTSVLLTDRILERTECNRSRGVSPARGLMASAVLYSNALKVSKYRAASSLLHAKMMQKSNTTETRVSSRRLLA